MARGWAHLDVSPVGEIPQAAEEAEHDGQEKHRHSNHSRKLVLLGQKNTGNVTTQNTRRVHVSQAKQECNTRTSFMAAAGNVSTRGHKNVPPAISYIPEDQHVFAVPVCPTNDSAIYQLGGEVNQLTDLEFINKIRCVHGPDRNLVGRFGPGKGDPN